MRNYLAVLGDVYHNGRVRMGGATGRLPTISAFQRHLQFDLSVGFPILKLDHTDFDKSLESFLLHYTNDVGNDDFWKTISEIKDHPEAPHTIKCVDLTDAPSMQVYPWRLLLHERMTLHFKKTFLQEEFISAPDEKIKALSERLDLGGVPRYRLDTSLYHATSDLYRETPNNIIRGALLSTYCAHKLGMLPGHYTHLMGEVYVQNQDLKAIKEILPLDPPILPTLLVEEWTPEGVTLLGFE